MKTKTAEILMDSSMIKSTFDKKLMNRHRNYLTNWLTFVNDSSLIYNYISYDTYYRAAAPQILLVEKGCTDGNINNKACRLKKGDLVLIPTNTLFSIHSISKDWKMRLVEFRMPQAIQQKMAFFHLNVIPLSNSIFCRIRSYFNLIANCMEEREKLFFPIEHLLLSLLGYINILFDSMTELQPKNRKEVLYENFMEELNREDVIFSRNVSYYAGKLQISPKYLGNVVKEISGKSVQHWILNFTLHSAQEMLGKSDVHIKEIATRLGFEDASSFSRFFRKHTGMTPRAYREEGTREE